jgi:hypothetical protein
MYLTMIIRFYFISIIAIISKHLNIFIQIKKQKEMFFFRKETSLIN